MNEAVRDALSEQITEEFHAAYLYLAMAAHFELQSLDGFSHWMRLQSDEEIGHAMRLFNYLLERGEKVELGSIDSPTNDFGSPLDVFRKALDHEKKVSEMIHELYDLALEKHDHATQLQLQWFVTEQVEEEDLVGNVVARVEMAGDDRAALLMLDRELGGRSDEEG